MYAFRIGFVALSFLLTAATAEAQFNRGSISGVVRDPSGAAIVSAQVVATHVDTNTLSKTISTGVGDYTLPGLDIGTYRVTVEAPGFRRALQTNLTVEPGAVLRADFILEVGSSTETVEVSARAVVLDQRRR